MSKRRSDAKLFGLEEAKQAQIAEWLLTPGMPVWKVAELVEREFGVKAGKTAFTHFYEEVCLPLHLERRSRAVCAAREIGEDARKRPAQFNEATVDALESAALELAIAPNPEPKMIKAIYSLVLKARDQSLEERKIKLLEKKAEQADEAKAALGDSALSAEEREKRMRQIFGLS